MADDAAVGTKAWTNPGNVAASDNTYATLTCTAGTLAETTHYIKATNFGFAVPSGATINGITVSIERKASLSEVSKYFKDSTVSLVKGGTVSGANKAATATAWPTSDAVATYGGAADLWTLTLTDSDVNTSTFGVVLSCLMRDRFGSGVTGSVDLITITIDYTAGASFSPGRASRSSQIIGGAG